MINVQRVIRIFIIILLGIGTTASSCKKKDDDDSTDFPPIDRGEFTANRFLLHIAEKRDPDNYTTYEYYAPRGVVARADTIKFRKGASGGVVSYTSYIDFMYEGDTLTSRIEAKSNNYIVCYRNLFQKSVQVGEFNTDADGKILGTELGWKVQEARGAPDIDRVWISLNYIPGIKENRCDAGSRIIEAWLPYVISD